MKENIKVGDMMSFTISKNISGEFVQIQTKSRVCKITDHYILTESGNKFFKIKA